MHEDVIHRLNTRAPGDQTACYTPKEERSIDDAVTNYPTCAKQVDALGKQVSSAESDVQAQKDKAAANQKIIDAEEGYRKLLEAAYRQIFDMHPPKYRSAKCVWLWECGARKTAIKLPDLPLPLALNSR